MPLKQRVLGVLARSQFASKRFTQNNAVSRYY
jgi:hypothetical protein